MLDSQHSDQSSFLLVRGWQDCQIAPGVSQANQSVIRNLIIRIWLLSTLQRVLSSSSDTTRKIRKHKKIKYEQTASTATSPLFPWSGDDNARQPAQWPAPSSPGEVMAILDSQHSEQPPLSLVW